MADRFALPLETPVQCITKRFGPKFYLASGVIVGNRSTLHTIWSDYAVRFDNGETLAVHWYEVQKEERSG